MDPAKLIRSSSDVMHGAPVFASTRVLVQTLFDYSEAGDTLTDFLEDFPTVSRNSAVGVLELAAEDLLDAVVTGRIAATKAPG